MSKSEPKTHSYENNVYLPFPHPMATNGSIVWPFSQRGFPLFYGFINFDEKCVEICDEICVKVFQNLGFFGFHSKFNSFNDTKSVSFRHQNKDFFESKDEKDFKTHLKSKYFNGKYVCLSTTVPNALSETSLGDNRCPHESDPKESTNVENNCKDVKTFDPKSDTNVLKLSFLESFFISYVFGSLNVLNTKSNNYLSIDEMWNTFGLNYSEDELEFAIHYSAYHYFRSKGWVVRNGQSFGTHFLLYKEGPHLYHALYSVVIQSSIDGQYRRAIDWYHMLSLIRLSRNVRKEMIVCVVNMPKDYDISSANCIMNFEIQVSFGRHVKNCFNDWFLNSYYNLIVGLHPKKPFSD